MYQTSSMFVAGGIKQTPKLAGFLRHPVVCHVSFKICNFHQGSQSRKRHRIFIYAIWSRTQQPMKPKYSLNQTNQSFPWACCNSVLSFHIFLRYLEDGSGLLHFVNKIFKKLGSKNQLNSRSKLLWEMLTSLYLSQSLISTNLEFTIQKQILSCYLDSKFTNQFIKLYQPRTLYYRVNKRNIISKQNIFMVKSSTNMWLCSYTCACIL